MNKCWVVIFLKDVLTIICRIVIWRTVETLRSQERNEGRNVPVVNTLTFGQHVQLWNSFHRDEHIYNIININMCSYTIPYCETRHSGCWPQRLNYYSDRLHDQTFQRVLHWVDGWYRWSYDLRERATSAGICIGSTMHYQVHWEIISVLKIKCLEPVNHKIAQNQFLNINTLWVRRRTLQEGCWQVQERWTTSFSDLQIGSQFLCSCYQSDPKFREFLRPLKHSHLFIIKTRLLLSILCIL